MTSNIGAKQITQKGGSLGFTANEEGETMSQSKIKESVMSEVKRTLRPEFLNRVDDIIVFQQLGKEDIKEIARRMLNTLSKRISQMGIEIEYTDEAINKISAAGFDPIYGARPLRRAIQSQIEDNLSEKMLDGTIKSGKAYICTIEDERFVFNEKKTAKDEPQAESEAEQTAE
jgi:ATP-dependent Clp protease ATP-binding subunit ClpC